MKKIDTALRLCADKKDQTTFNRGLKIFSDLSNNQLYSSETRVKAIVSLFDVAPDEAVDKLARSRQALPFYTEKKLDTEVSFLKKVCGCDNLMSHEKLMIAIELYNNQMIMDAYECFEMIVDSQSSQVQHKVEACRFLFYSEIKDKVDKVYVFLREMVDDEGIASKYKYETICSFNARTGLATKYNAAKLWVSYDETLLYVLQKAFFFNENNDTVYRILSGQHLLQMTLKTEEKDQEDDQQEDEFFIIGEEKANKRGVITEEEKIKVGNVILSIASTFTHSEPKTQHTTRADAADVVARLGTPEQKLQAIEVISSLGREGRQGFGKATIYENKENIHDTEISQSIESFMEEIIKKNVNHDIETFSNVYNEVTKLINFSDTDPRQRHLAFKALSRISIDTATFTERNLTSATVFVHIWTYILHYEDDKSINEMKKRLIEELIDMASTCSTGHARRLVNVLNGYGFELKISFNDQIIANANAALQRYIKNIEDEDEKSDIVCGMNPEIAEEEDRQKYIEYVKNTVGSIQKELRDEFVGEGWTTDKVFDEAFMLAKAAWY